MCDFFIFWNDRENVHPKKGKRKYVEACFQIRIFTSVILFKNNLQIQETETLIFNLARRGGV